MGLQRVPTVKVEGPITEIRANPSTPQTKDLPGSSVSNHRKLSATQLNIPQSSGSLEVPLEDKQLSPSVNGSRGNSVSGSPTNTSPTQSLEKQQKPSKRRPHSKSRRGCATCKKRRVKCDETHPICKNCQHLDLECSFSTNAPAPFVQGSLNIMDIRLFHHYTTIVWKTIVAAGISNDEIWSKDVPELAFEYPFLMHSILTFSATHFSRTHQSAIDQVVTFHRGDALRLLSEEVRNVTPQNLDALVAASILLILDSLANASSDSTSPSSLPPSAWLHHVRGAATILTAVGPPSQESRFYSLVNVDLSDLAQGLMTTMPGMDILSPLEYFDDDLKELYPVSISSPYYHALAYLDKLFRQRYKSDFILRVFSFPALLDRNLVGMLIQGDSWAKRIIRVYYKLVRSFTSEMKESVWFLEGVAKVLPIDMDSEFGGLGFITQALPLHLPAVEMLMQASSSNNPGDIPSTFDLNSLPGDLFANSDIDALAASLNFPVSGSLSSLLETATAGGSGLGALRTDDASNSNMLAQLLASASNSAALNSAVTGQQGLNKDHLQQQSPEDDVQMTEENDSPSAIDTAGNRASISISSVTSASPQSS